MKQHIMEEQRIGPDELDRQESKIYLELLKLHPSNLATLLEEKFNEISKSHSEDQKVSKDNN
jgi:hypothetical protein